MLRFLFTKEVRGYFREILQKFPDFEEDMGSIRSREAQDAKHMHINLINKTDVMFFILATEFPGVGRPAKVMAESIG
jgi:hypothetical protein